MGFAFGSLAGNLFAALPEPPSIPSAVLMKQLFFTPPNDKSWGEVSEMRPWA